MTETHFTSDIYGLLIDTDTLCVLLLHDDSGQWTLPQIHLETRIYLHQVGIVSESMSALLGADITVLRNVDAVYSANWQHRALTYRLENHTSPWTPPANAHWVAQDILADLPLAQPDHRAIIAENLMEVARGQQPILRPPWAQPGWYTKAAGWMCQTLVEQGYTLTSPITQFKSWGISCLLRAETDRGTIYFKVATALPLFGNEPALQAALAARYPDEVPPPLAVEHESRWMLMRDFGMVLSRAPSFDKWSIVLDHYARLQVQSASTIDELLAVGCLDRRLDVLRSQIDPLLSDDEALAPLSPDEITRLRALAPRLKAMCDELAQFSIPYALVHGDFHSGNITGETLLFFDWTDACIAHPFLDLCTVMENLERDNIEGRERLLETYFRAWTTYESLERIQAAWRLAEPLGSLHQAVSYRHILAILEPTSKREMVWGVPEWLRRMLRTLPDPV
ncbi:MAG: aminoglycoside phosphotransferase family protein [Anaerolineae bacterium]|nr:aminoglycoside phosphotransferase family protein [Anaerolineae bacterium]